MTTPLIICIGVFVLWTGGILVWGIKEGRRQARAEHLEVLKNVRHRP